MTSSSVSPPTASDSDTPLAANVRFGHGRGWSFTPLDGKKPILRGWQKRPRETLDEALAWAANGNVGLRTGQNSGIVVVDVDQGGDVSSLHLPKTITAITGGGGQHYYFRYDKSVGNSAGKLGEHIDVRGDGGQVVFSGSVHPETHKPYTWEPEHAPWEIEAAELPTAILAILQAGDVPPTAATLAPVRPGPAKTSGTPAQQKYTRRALQLELNAVHTAIEGQRNATLNKSAFSLGQFIASGYLDRGEVEELLRTAALAVGLGETETDATIRSGIESGLQQPREIPKRPDPPPRIDLPSPSTDDIPPLPNGQFKLNLYGNADRFMHLYGRDVLWCEQRGCWLIWDGTCWQADAMRRVEELAERTMQALMQEVRGDKDAQKWAVRCTKTATPAREMIDVIKHRVPVAMDDVDADPWLLGVANGVIDLRSGALRPHEREDRITLLSPVMYDTAAVCPRWDAFLDEIMAGDAGMVDALQRLAGYCLTGDISVQILPIFHGPGGNGKNVMLDTLMGILGPHAAEAPDGLLTVRHGGDEHPTEIADLLGKRLVVASETDEGRKMRIGLVKKLTGNKYLKGRFMRQDYFQFVRTHKTILVTNNRPIVTETSNAIWRRLRLIPFDVTIPEAKQDKRLTEKLVAEWPGILAWAVRGCLDWQQRQCDLEFPEAVRQATEAYKDESDHIGDFLDECCTDWRKHPEQKMRVPKERVHSIYCSWCKTVGEDVLSRRSFSTRMQSHGFEDGQGKINGINHKCWFNLTLKGNCDE